MDGDPQLDPPPLHPVGRTVTTPTLPAQRDGSDGSLLLPVADRVTGRTQAIGVPTGWHPLLERLADEVSVRPDTEPDSKREPPDLDTVVAFDEPIAQVVESAASGLARDGTLLYAVDGWAVNLRAEAWSPTKALGDVLRRNSRRLRRSLERAGFSDIEIYGVYPDIREPEFVYPVTETDATRWFIDHAFGGLLERGARLAHRTAVFRDGQPGYLVVASPQDPTEKVDKSVAQITYNRVVTFDLEGTDLSRVEKMPRPGGAATVRAEQMILDSLRASSTDVPPSVLDSLPNGSIAHGPTGPIRQEEAVTAPPIADHVEPTPDGFAQTLEVAFDWLAAFQSAYRGPARTIEPSTLHRRVYCPRLGITDPPRFSEPVESFEAPVHGDFHPWNVFSDGTEVTGVLDWEYGTESGDPAIDAALFLLHAAALVGDGFEDGFERVFAEDTAYSAVARDAIQNYTSAVGLDSRAVVAALPYAPIHIIESLVEQGKPPGYVPLCHRYGPWVEEIVASMDGLRETIIES